jgi:hypothetical protein
MSEGGRKRPKHVACRVEHSETVVFDDDVSVVIGLRRYNGVNSIKILGGQFHFQSSLPLGKLPVVQIELEVL